MGAFISALTGLFDLVFLPFRSLHPVWGLTIVSLVTGLIMLWLWGKVSDQDAIKLVRDRIRGNLIAIRLFGDDLGLLFKLQGRIIGQTLVYMRYALFPMLILIIPVILILTQLHLRYEARPLLPDEQAVVKVELREDVPVDGAVRLEVPAGVAVETPPVHAARIHEVSWRIRAEEPGEYELKVHTAGGVLGKELRVGEEWGPTSPRRTGMGFLDLLLFSGEDPIPEASPVARIDVTYPAQDPPLTVFGFGVHWLIFFFVASLAFGFLFKKPFGVEI
jgi:uncharacterized membrane protein (DUF106 family)